MNDQIIVSAAALLGIAILALSALRGWQGWLALKQRELERVGATQRREIDTGSALGGARIEIADLKERIRKLEAIASGVDL
jgi:hypothetical protein